MCQRLYVCKCKEGNKKQPDAQGCCNNTKCPNSQGYKELHCSLQLGCRQQLFSPLRVSQKVSDVGVCYLILNSYQFPHRKPLWIKASLNQTQ